MLSKDGSHHVTDEHWNTILHLAGAIYAMMLLVLLVAFASAAGKPWHIVSFAVYGTSLVCLFLASTLHHGVNIRSLDKYFRIADYCGVFFLIAGTFTPLCLVIARGVLGWSVFGVVWGIAAVGIALKILFPNIPKWATNTLYVCMGWLAIILTPTLWHALPLPAFALLAAGGLAYTLGSFIYLKEIPNPIPSRFGFHEIWHVLVLIGALTHGLMMYFAVLPMA